MCGIHIILDKKNHLTEIPIQHMLACTHHRGPDAQQFLRVNGKHQTLWIASNRLKVSDLSDKANQPMQSPDGRYTLAFNGAIYNDKQLRQQLAHVEFVTTSDTEALLHFLIVESTEAIPKLNGMFAFAFYDKQTETLLLARDAWGMKPLYWFENDSYLIASSEIRGILASGLVQKEANLQQLSHYLTFNFARRPETFYQNIQEMEPGTIHVAQPGQRLTEVERFGSLHQEGFGTAQDTIFPTTDFSALVNQLDTTLAMVMKRHSQADVRAGLFLSGGVDSTLLLASAYEQGIRDLPAFTIGYSVANQPYATQDEAFARQAAKQYQADLHLIPISEQLLEQFPDWVSTLDQPVADGAAWLTYLLAQEAKKHVTVVLSGAGADELFAGYNRHWAFNQYLKYYSLLQKLHAITKNSISARSKTSSFLQNTYYGRLIYKGLLQLHPSPAHTFIRFTAGTTAFPWLGDLASQIESGFGPVLSKKPFRENYLAAALKFDQRHYLISDVLAITDRMTMQHGIEARLPYLDDSLVALAKNIPADFLLRHGRKGLLKKILSLKNGKAYTQRRKEGFGMPMAHWLRTPAGTTVLSPLYNRSNLIYQVVDYSFVQNLIYSHLQRKTNHAAELWALALAAAWLDKEFC